MAADWTMRPGTANLTDCTLSGNSANVGGGLNRLSGDGEPDRLHPQRQLGRIQRRPEQSRHVEPDRLHDQRQFRLGGGGGVGIGPGTATLTNCTITGNSAALGGGLRNYGPATLTACTISGNTASTAGGLANESGAGYTGTATLTDTIVAGNTAPGGAASDIGGSDPADVTGTYNLIGTGGSGGITGGTNGNLVGVDEPGAGLAGGQRRAHADHGPA